MTGKFKNDQSVFAYIVLVVGSILKRLAERNLIELVSGKTAGIKVVGGRWKLQKEGNSGM